MSITMITNVIVMLITKVCNVNNNIVMIITKVCNGNNNDYKCNCNADNKSL
jgi:hypothetical protein